MSNLDPKTYIAKRVAREFKEGDIVNLGIGLPTMVCNYVPDDIHIFLQSENGFINIGPVPSTENIDLHLTNAGGNPVSILPGGAFFDSCTSFAMIRGGHIDVTVLGSLQVDEEGNLANWIIPGKMVPGMGGAMDLVVGSKKVIVTMLHTNKGAPKILKRCTLPLTAQKQVDTIITEMGVFCVQEQGLCLSEYNPRFSIQDIKDATQAQFMLSTSLKEMDIDTI